MDNLKRATHYKADGKSGIIIVIFLRHICRDMLSIYYVAVCADAAGGAPRRVRGLHLHSREHTRQAGEGEILSTYIYLYLVISTDICLYLVSSDIHCRW